MMILKCQWMQKKFSCNAVETVFSWKGRSPAATHTWGSCCADDGTRVGGKSDGRKYCSSVEETSLIFIHIWQIYQEDPVVEEEIWHWTYYDRTGTRNFVNFRRDLKESHPRIRIEEKRKCKEKRKPALSKKHIAVQYFWIWMINTEIQMAKQRSSSWAIIYFRRGAEKKT